MSAAGDDVKDAAPSLAALPLYPTTAFTVASPETAAAAGGGRNPRCARCSNHGVSVPLKGHKAYCTYRRCECDKCQLVVLRRTIMAQQVSEEAVTESMSSHGPPHIVVRMTFARAAPPALDR